MYFAELSIDRMQEGWGANNVAVLRQDLQLLKKMKHGELAASFSGVLVRAITRGLSSSPSSFQEFRHTRPC
jgi:hypothetical protein